MVNRDNEYHGFTTRENINSDKFIEFIDEFIPKLETPTVLLLDKASLHKSKKVKAKISEWQDANLYIMYLPPNVTNLWVNRMVGDEQEPDDITWSDPLQYTFASGSPVAGRYMAEIPAWLSDGTERPSKGRKTVVGFKFFASDSPLMPSGLLGPVRLRIVR